jgi:hypothetical protein
VLLLLLLGMVLSGRLLLLLLLLLVHPGGVRRVELVVSVDVCGGHHPAGLGAPAARCA